MKWIRCILCRCKSVKLSCQLKLLDLSSSPKLRFISAARCEQPISYEINLFQILPLVFKCKNRKKINIVLVFFFFQNVIVILCQLEM